MCDEKFIRTKHDFRIILDLSNARIEICCLSARTLLIRIDLLFDELSERNVYSSLLHSKLNTCTNYTSLCTMWTIESFFKWKSVWKRLTNHISFQTSLNICPLSLMGSRDSVVCIATTYKKNDREVGVPSPGKVQIGSGVHPTSYAMGTDSSFPGVNRPGCEADHSPPASAEVNKMWIYTSTPPYAFMASCLIS
jgi:hypothetical protein